MALSVPSRGSVSASAPSQAACANCRCSLVSTTEANFQLVLRPGKYVIGRSATPINDPWFINLESPTSGVSRSHAAIVICGNGDAWVEDTCSTNGSFLMVRPGAGEGTRLEPQHYYYLVDDAFIVFGDAEFRFVREPLTTYASGAAAGGLHAQIREGRRLRAEAAANCGSNVTSRDQPSTGHPPVPIEEAKPLSGAEVSRVTSAAVAEQSGKQSRHTGETGGGQLFDPSGAVLGAAAVATKEETLTVQESAASVAPVADDAASMSAAAASAHESRAQRVAAHPKSARRDVESGVEEPPIRRGRRDDDRCFSAFGAAIEACLSGYDGKTRSRVAKLVTAKGGHVSDDWGKGVNLLVVSSSPTVRTPKVITAVGTGVDVVLTKFVENGTVAAADVCPAIESDGVGVIPSGRVREAIVKHRDCGPALAGRAFDTSALPKSARDQLNAIIRACGGTVSASTKASRGKGATQIGDTAAIDSLYNEILTGGH